MKHLDCGGEVEKTGQKYVCQVCKKEFQNLGADVLILDPSSEIVDFEIEGKKYRMENKEVKPREEI